MRIIDADAVADELEAMGARLPGSGQRMTLRIIANGLRHDKSLAPTIDPASLRPKGEWITASFWKSRKGHHVQLVFKKCSLCNIRVKARWNNNFCPNCGADMRGETHDS